MAIGSQETLEGGIIVGSIKNIIREYQNKVSGLMRDVPKWVGTGLIVSLQGGENRVEELIDAMLFDKIKVSAVWIQDWCGRRKQTLLGKDQYRLWWNVINLNSDINDLSGNQMTIFTRIGSCLSKKSIQRALRCLLIYHT